MIRRTYAKIDNDDTRWEHRNVQFVLSFGRIFFHFDEKVVLSNIPYITIAGFVLERTGEWVTTGTAQRVQVDRLASFTNIICHGK